MDSRPPFEGMVSGTVEYALSLSIFTSDELTLLSVHLHLTCTTYFSLLFLFILTEISFLLSLPFSFFFISFFFLPRYFSPFYQFSHSLSLSHSLPFFCLSLHPAPHSVCSFLLPDYLFLATFPSSTCELFIGIVLSPFPSASMLSHNKSILCMFDH